MRVFIAFVKKHDNPYDHSLHKGSSISHTARKHATSIGLTHQEGHFETS